AGGVPPAGRAPGVPGAPGGGGVDGTPPRCGGGVVLLVSASAPSPGGGTCAPGGVLEAPGGGVPCATGSSTAGASAVFGSWLPPDISAVGASAGTDGGGVSSPDSLSCGANTVSGS